MRRDMVLGGEGVVFREKREAERAGAAK